MYNSVFEVKKGKQNLLFVPFTTFPLKKIIVFGTQELPKTFAGLSRAPQTHVDGRHRTRNPPPPPNPHKSRDPLQNRKKLSAAPHSVAFHCAKRPRWEQQCGLAARSGWVPVGDLAGFSCQSAHSAAFPLVGALTPAASNALEEARVLLFVSVPPISMLWEQGDEF